MTRSPRLSVAMFAAATFGLSWAVWVPLIWWTPPSALRQILLVVGTFGPSAVAAVLLAKCGGLRDELRQQWRWRLPAGFWSFILGGPPAVALLAIGITRLFGVPGADWKDPTQIALVLPVLAYVTLFGGPLGEELGWRGYVQPLLQRRLTPVSSALLIGVIWGLWHLPLFGISGTVQEQIPPVAFFTQVIATSVIYGWVWNRTTSLPAVIGIHAVTNTTVGVLPVLPEQAGSSAPIWTAVGLAVAIAVGLAARTAGTLGRRQLLPAVTPGGPVGHREGDQRSGRRIPRHREDRTPRRSADPGRASSPPSPRR